MERVSELLAKKAKFQIGDEAAVERMAELPAGVPFDEGRIEFLNRVSRELMADKEARGYPDVVTFAFWIRRANMEKEKAEFLADGRLRMGRGVAFHIAPSNVAVNYAYSFAAGFVLGNANIVRLPSKEFAQTELINRGIRRVLDRPEYKKWQDCIAFLRYERNKEINDCFSSLCDVRVVWGGDQTIREIRKSELKPRAGEITFADRYSIGIIDAEAYLEMDEKDKAAQGFYNDTYLTDQNACTAPRLICWLGGKEKIRQAKEIFWEKLWNVVDRNYAFQPVQYVDKLTSCCMAAVGIDGLCAVRMKDNRIVRLEVERLEPALQEHRGNSGLFYEYEMEDVMELVPLCSERMQTVVMLGNREKLVPLLQSGVKGIDRVAEVGRSMDFGFVWDGMDLRERMTRVIQKERSRKLNSK